MYFEEDLMSEQLLNLDFNEFITKINTKYIGKNNKISTKVRQKGNQLYIRKSHNAEIHKEIFNLYSMSVTFAIDASEELALAYGNRSAFLLHLGKYKESLEDLDKALNITMSNILKVKLYCRRVECLILLGLSGKQIAFKEAIKYFNKIENKNEKESLHNNINKTKHILEYNKVNVVSKKEHKKYPLIEKLLEKEKDIFSNIDINYSEKYGRYLVTTKEYKPGQIIYIEKPYVTCSNNKNPYIYCCHCLAIAWAGIPCKYCNWCIFCSVKCRVEAWKTYHNIECSVFPYIKKFSKNFVQSFQLSVKVMLMGMKEFDTIDKFKSEIEYIDKYNDKRTKGFSNDGEFVNTRFRSIYSLSNNISKQQFKTNVQNTAIALACIIKYTSFFKFNFVTNQELKSLIKNSEVVFIGTLLLKLINITCNNRHIIFNSLQACNKNSQPLRCAIAQCCSKGICLAPVSSLINNSCIPNVKRCFTEDHKIIIYAVETIPQNSQIFDSYLCNFYDVPNIYRNTLFEQYFYFTCNCVACERNWPPLLNFIQIEQKFMNTSRSFLETKFIEENKELLTLIHKKDAKFNENIIQDLAKAIEKASKILPQPCSIKCILTFSLQMVFEKLYGYNIQIFDNCQSRIKP